jgi:MFS family permease
MSPLFTPATIIAAFLFGAISSYLAHRRGRSPVRWFFVGFLFGILGLFAVFLAPAMKRKAVQPALPPEEKPLPVIDGPSDKFWYYLDPAHQQQGPMSHNALTTALRQGKISLSTYVWNEDMPDWKILQEFVKG